MARDEGPLTAAEQELAAFTGVGDQPTSPKAEADGDRLVADGQAERAEQDRYLWPYLDQPWRGATNGRELGAWLLGHLWGRQKYGEPGLRVRVPASYLAAVAAVCVENGVLIQRHSTGDDGITVDLWT